MGYRISKSFVQEAECEMYFSCYNLFLQFLYYGRKNKQLTGSVVSMLSCGTLERNSNSYVELIVEPYVSKNHKRIFAMWV